MLIPDPCGQEPGYEFIIACFLEQLMNSHNSRADTVCGYVKAINILFELRDFEIPGDTSDKENLSSKIIHARERKEDIAKQRSPITTEMFTAMADKAISSKEDSIDSVIFIGSFLYKSQACASLNMPNVIKPKSISMNIHPVRG